MHRTTVLRSLAALFLLTWVITGCALNWSGTEVSPTATPLPLGPAVISNNPDIAVETWEYTDPRSEDALQQFPSRDPQAIKFGPDPQEAYVLWHEDGFDLVWGGYLCSTQPVVIISEGTIELWPNDTFWDDCEAAEKIHAFRVDLETSIPREDWSHELHLGTPPVDPLPVEDQR